MAMENKKETQGAVAVAACVGELGRGVPTEIMLVPAGDFRARDGRPKGINAWHIDAASAGRLIVKAADALGDAVIDYEHQTLLADENGKPAPAAGWFKKLEWREDDGLYAVDVRWTDRACALILAGEYRYISPVLEYDKQTGVILGVPMAALTNYPAIDGHSDLAARAAAKFQTAKEEDQVDREKLIAMLGLNKDADDEQITGAITALKTRADSADGKDAEIASLKADGGKPDPARFVPVETFEALKTEVADLKAGQNSTAVDALVREGLDAGKLLPVQEEWARELGNKDIVQLKGYLAKTPAVAALKGDTQSGGKTPEGEGGKELSDTELAVCRNLGIDAEDYKKTAVGKAEGI